MDWIGQDFYTLVKTNYEFLLRKYGQVALFNNLRLWKGSRVYKFKFGDSNLVLKMEEIDHVKDDVLHEYKIGLQLNELRYIIPNIVPTIAYITGNPEVKKMNIPPCHYITKHNVPFIIVGHEPGSTVNDSLTIKQQLEIWVQVYSAIYMAYKKFGFTHYNLHRGNVVVRPLNKYISYPGFHLLAEYLAIIIDYGRSYTYEHGGRVYPSRMVHPECNLHHDILNYLYSVFRDKYKPLFRELLELHGYKDISSNLNYTIGQNRNVKLITPGQLVNYLIDHYQVMIKINVSPEDEVLTPSNPEFHIKGAIFPRLKSIPGLESVFKLEVRKRSRGKEDLF
jgi:hypothetical protein